ncbi:hypothetical protein [Fibrella aquatilis]|uniref:Uncharacterized protein n=1 Tax=Fibrella aquatilis TaxID=2817059 RepID=A0A939GBP3_9BACT|nr:hypothetical protein [Fibrella aquatilis]MBO0934595.1 hypothetical protein [Fibrella aquatilis]
MGAIIQPLTPKGIQTPVYTLPTIPKPYTPATSGTAGTATTKNPFDWGKLVDSVFGTAGKVLDWQTAKEQAKLPQFDPSQYQNAGSDTPGNGGSGGGIDSTTLLLIGGGVALYLLLK